MVSLKPTNPRDLAPANDIEALNAAHGPALKSVFAE